MSVLFDLTPTRAGLRCIAGSTLSLKGRQRENDCGGRRGWFSRMVAHSSIGRQSFLIRSQKIYRNEPRWRIVMTWPCAREVDMEHDIYGCMCVCVYNICIYIQTSIYMYVSVR